MVRVQSVLPIASDVYIGGLSRSQLTSSKVSQIVLINLKD